MESREDCSHSGVGNDYVCLCKASLKLGRFKKLRELDVLWLPASFSDLCEYIATTRFRCPAINSLQKAIERHIGSNGDENHDALKDS